MAKKKYKVLGPPQILGHSPGVTFEDDLPEWQEKALVEGGGLEVVGESSTDGVQVTDQVQASDEASVELKPSASSESPSEEKPSGEKGK